MSKRILIWTQHLLGIGHFSRSRLIAEGLRDAGYDVVVVVGGILPPGTLIVGVRLVQLPAVRAKNELFDELVDEHGREVSDDLLQKRREQMLSAFEEYSPDAVITETFPFGRRLVQDEVLALIDTVWHAKRPVKLVSSVRDVLQRPRKDERAKAMVALALKYYDRILVHSDPAVIRAELGFPEFSTLQHLLNYTGYVCRRLDVDVKARDEVIVSAGGGAVGDALLNAAIEARPLTNLRHRPWIFVTGPNGKIPVGSEAGITVVRSLPDFQTRLSQAAVSVSQAGYNTICETLSARTPCVVVPFETDREKEQITRATRLEIIGLCCVLRQSEISATKLASSINHAADRGMPQHAINLDGISGTVEAMADLLG
jgi:predicted glycosyltransferase